MKILIISLYLLLLSLPIIAIAAGPASVAEPCKAGNVCIANPLGAGMDSPQAFIGRIIKGLLGVVGSVALIMFVWGGFQIMTAAGAPAKVKSGIDTMKWAALGLVLIFSSYALVFFIIEKVAS